MKGDFWERGQTAHPFISPWLLLPMGFPRQEYWSGLPFPPPGDLSHQEIVSGAATLRQRYTYQKRGTRNCDYSIGLLRLTAKDI